MNLKATTILLITMLTSLLLNSFFNSKSAEDLYRLSKETDISSIESISESFDGIKALYEKKEPLISLTVSHEDLTSISDALADIIGACRANDKESAIIAKSRFEASVLHLSRLSVLNAESLF